MYVSVFIFARRYNNVKNSFSLAFFRNDILKRNFSRIIEATRGSRKISASFTYVFPLRNNPEFGRITAAITARSSHARRALRWLLLLRSFMAITYGYKWSRRSGLFAATFPRSLMNVSPRVFPRGNTGCSVIGAFDASGDIPRGKLRWYFSYISIETRTILRTIKEQIVLKSRVNDFRDMQRDNTTLWYLSIFKINIFISVSIWSVWSERYKILKA